MTLYLLNSTLLDKWKPYQFFFLLKKTLSIYVSNNQVGCQKNKVVTIKLKLLSSKKKNYQVEVQIQLTSQISKPGKLVTKK